MLDRAGDGDVGMGDAVAEPMIVGAFGAVCLERGDGFADLGAAAGHVFV